MKIRGGASMQAEATLEAEKQKGKPARAYASSETVGDSYDSWTQDGILEYYWGDHIHLGYYPEGRVRGENFIEAKAVLTKNLFEWAVPDFAQKEGAKLLDAGCGIGGSTRQLARDYGLSEATGIAISHGQVARATELTTDANVKFQQMDALNMEFPDNTFDIVWSVEMEPHIPDKRKMCDELLRVLKPGGTLVLAGWNVRDDSVIPLSPNEHQQVTHLLEEWSHPNFWSIEQYVKVFESIPGVTVRHDDWSIYTHPSWMQSITTMFRRPKGIFMALANPRKVKERVRDLYTLYDWHKAMGKGLMHFGVFSVTKQ
jgi:MPBQ/MSBQ methyltransferase